MAASVVKGTCALAVVEVEAASPQEPGRLICGFTPSLSGHPGGWGPPARPGREAVLFSCPFKQDMTSSKFKKLFLFLLP